MRSTWRTRITYIGAFVISGFVTMLMIRDFQQASGWHRQQLIMERDLDIMPHPGLIRTLKAPQDGGGDQLRYDGEKAESAYFGNDANAAQGINQYQQSKYDETSNSDSSRSNDKLSESSEYQQTLTDQFISVKDAEVKNEGVVRSGSEGFSYVSPDKVVERGNGKSQELSLDSPQPQLVHEENNNEAAKLLPNMDDKILTESQPDKDESPSPARSEDGNSNDEKNAAEPKFISDQNATSGNNLAVQSVAVDSNNNPSTDEGKPATDEDKPAVIVREVEERPSTIRRAEELEICKRLESGSSHLSPYTTISRRIMVMDPPFTPEEIAEVYRQGCGLVSEKASDGQATWREGAIQFNPSNVTGVKRLGKVVVYNADFEPHIPYNHTVFFEGRDHPEVEYKDRKILLTRLSGWDDVNEPVPLKACPDLPCMMTTDWKKYARTAAAISFNGQLVKGKAPKRFHPDQVFIMYFYEPLTNPWPGYRALNTRSHGWRSIFNWTMTYHLTSDILATYGMIRLRPSSISSTKNYTEVIARKTKKIAWFVSHCRTESKRETYVEELQKYISVDIYGKCGPFSCHKQDDTTCFSTVGREYKFYLAFENAMCEDYTTEKFFRIFKSDAIVVSRGNDHLYRSLPTDTFIDAAKFGSPKALAEHLLYLDSHPEEYAALLARKDQFFASYQDYPHYVNNQLWVKYTWENVPLCEVCQRVWNLDKYRNSYPDILGWLNTRKCYDPKDL